MPDSLYHVAAVTPEPERLIAFMRDVLGNDEPKEVGVPVEDAMVGLDWPLDAPEVRCWWVGEPKRGLLEIIAVPPTLTDQVPAGFPVVTFSTPDLEDRVQRCRDLGYDVTDIHRIVFEGREVHRAIVTVAGLRLELLHFPT